MGVFISQTSNLRGYYQRKTKADLRDTVDMLYGMLKLPKPDFEPDRDKWDLVNQALALHKLLPND